ncbi:MAG: hypothetical protein ACE5K0_06090 [Candidatus Methanofastidiosia archaeon]
MAILESLLRSGNRKKIFKALSLRKAITSKELSNKTNLSWQETSKQLKLLEKMGLSTRVGTSYSLSQMGNLLKIKLEDFYKIEEKIIFLRDFIEKHDLSEIPGDLIREFGVWDAELLKMHPTEFYPLLEDVVKSTKRKLFLSNSLFLRLEVKKKVEVRAIYALEAMKGDNLVYRQKLDGFSIRAIPRRKLYFFSLISDEERAWIGFRDFKREFDFSQILYGGGEFCGWVLQNFEYLWERSKEI